MVGIAFEAGFNSKTTFNTAFKKATGFSPSEFQKMSLEKELA
jgi:AraC-like DNA-binding protein